MNEPPPGRPSPRRLWFWTSLTGRFVTAFLTLTVILALAAASAMLAVGEMHRNLHAVLQREAGLQAALELSSGVRDQYAHQAHTIIIGDTSHLGFYRESRERVKVLVARVRSIASDPGQRAACDEIERTSEELDTLFLSEVVPAVLAGQVERIRTKHADAQTLVTRAQEAADRLGRSFERAIAAFEDHAGLVQHRAYRRMVLVLAGSTLSAIAVGIYLGALVRRSLFGLTAGTERVRAGDLDTRIAVSGPDEFAALARSFNEMTATLRRNSEQLVQSEKLAGIGRLAAGVAHEINNPLTVVLGYVRILRRAARGQAAEDLAVVEQEAVQCQEIVQALLDMSRPLPTRGESVDVRRLADEIVERLSGTWTGPPPRVDIEGAGEALGNPARLRQVLTNLLRNAFEAAGAQGHVGVRVKEDGRNVQFEVQDDGPGLPQELRDRIFEPFFTTKPNGTGLGLALSQAIVSAHGGQLAASFPPGATTLTLVLPRPESA